MIGRSMSLPQLDLRTPVLVPFRINVNSGCDWGVSDPLAVHKDDGTHGRARDFFRGHSGKRPRRMHWRSIGKLHHPGYGGVLALGSTGIPRSGSLLVQIFLPTLSAKLCVGKADRLSSYLVWLKTPSLWLAVFCASGLP